MNWLAHTFLSEPEIEFRLGNLLADLVRGEERAQMSAAFVRGTECHKAIDVFTDAHPLVRRSRLRLGPAHRRFSGVIIDVFYDHLLATHWPEYSSVTLAEFTTQFYAAVAARQLRLPPTARVTLERIVRHDSLGSYRSIEAVERALQRISTYLSGRWDRPFALERCVPVLLTHATQLAEDFVEFFPQLRSHVDSWSRSH